MPCRMPNWKKFVPSVALNSSMTRAETQHAFTHDDYVEAARQCLAIEQDMQDILAEHPEILEELEQEREYMMQEKERLEQELEQAEKRADGRQHYPNENSHEETTFTTNNEEESPHEVVDLDEEQDFDVVGHQEPLSDSRVHEETTTIKDTDNSNKVHPKRRLLQKRIHLSFRETIREFQERIQRDLTAIADIVFPKAMRGPTREALRKAGSSYTETSGKCLSICLEIYKGLY